MEIKLDRSRNEKESVAAAPVEIYAYRKLRSRWSPDFSEHRERWLPFSVFCSRDCHVGNSNLTDRDQAAAFLRALVGQSLKYAIKSPGLNLYDFGFSKQEALPVQSVAKNELYVLHVMCSFSLQQEGGPAKMYYGDVEPEFFKNAVGEFVGQTVRDVVLCEENHLQIVFERFVMNVITADDDIESWRFFTCHEEQAHLVASGENIGFTLG